MECLVEQPEQKRDQLSLITLDNVANEDHFQEHIVQLIMEDNELMSMSWKLY